MSDDISQTPCPCGSHQGYAACCGRWHAGPQRHQAPTPEALMRSRYCAYVLGLETYLLQTWHIGTRPAPPLGLDSGLRWLGLTIKRSGLTGPGQGEVEFVARSKRGGRASRMWENSRFVFEADRWWYVDGDLL